jgi:hypothetical protein
MEYVLRCLKRAADNSYAWSVTPAEAGALVAEIERLRAEVERERASVLDYLAYRIEMSHYGDAIKEFVNARDEIAEGVHLTINYDEVLP